jgi:hypothetical protein
LGWTYLLNHSLDYADNDLGPVQLYVVAAADQFQPAVFG